MITRLEKVDLSFLHPVDNSVFLVDTTRPSIRVEMFQRLRLAWPIKCISHGGFNQTKHFESESAICLNPVFEILEKLDG